MQQAEGLHPGESQPGIRKIWLFPKWFSESQFEQTATLIHETAHIAGVSNLFEKKYYEAEEAKKLAHHSPLLARRNATNFGYYAMAVTQSTP